MYGLPRLLENNIEAAQGRLSEETDRFEGSMLSEQESFKDEITVVDGTVGQFFKHTNLAKVTEISTEAKKIARRLAEAEKKAKQFNSREV
jgi:hypothetical protein